MITLIIITTSAILATITATILNYRTKEKELDKHFERKIKQIYNKQERDWEFYNKVQRECKG